MSIFDSDELSIMFEEEAVCANGVTKDDLLFKCKLLEEELNETLDAIGKNDIEKILDGFGDVQFLAYNGIYQTFRHLGLDKEDSFSRTKMVLGRIAKANYSKVMNGIVRNDKGKIMKPEGWQEPRYEDLIGDKND